METRRLANATFGSREIEERAQLVVQRPLRKLKSAQLNRAYDEFRRKTPRSAALASRAKRLLPRGSEHMIPPSEPYPLFMERGSGSTVTDVDGNSFVDNILSGGAILLGHNHPDLNRNICELISDKTNFHGFFDEYELKAAEQIIKVVPSAHRVRFTASGAEAVLAALRIARAFTGRKKIIKFRGAYHGWTSDLLTDLEIPGTERMFASGIPDELLDHTVLVRQNDLEGLERAFRDNYDKGGIAAVICEPLGADSGLLPFHEDFHAQAIEIAHRFGALYIFDEVVTAFRTGMGGAQAILNVNPDLTTLGKALMNGYPACGAVCGAAAIVDTATTSFPATSPFAYIAGTFSGNVLSAAACYYTLCELQRPGVLQRAFGIATDLVTRLNDLFESRDTAFFAYSFGAIVRIELTAAHAVPPSSPDSFSDIVERRMILNEYMVPILNSGVLSRMGRDMTSCAHIQADNDRTVAAYDALIDCLE
jgi:glutamate-1-semialdehyde aminotransferase